MAEPPEAGHHLVRDVEDVVLAADLADALQIVLRRHDHAAGRLDRLADEAADIFRADRLHPLAEFLDQEIAEGLDVMPFGRRNGSGEDSFTISPSAPSIQSRSRGRPLSEADR